MGKHWFWSKVDKSGGPDACWLWTGYKLGTGYGQVSRFKVHHRTHRLAYQLTKGPIPDGMNVCHACDVRLCCNPAHLWLGTQKENCIDAVRKHRSPLGKLTSQQVQEIRQSELPLKALAARYGVSFSTIARAKRGETWCHVPEPHERKKRAKLTHEQVQAIQADTRTGYVIGQEYGISYQQVSRIRRGERWSKA